MSASPTGLTAPVDTTAVGTDTGEPQRKRARTNRVTLNVGGQRYETTTLTLCSSTSSYFTALFGGTGAALGGSEDCDEIFIDRSGQIFTHVLQWLRSATLPAAVNADSLELADLLVEAEFYCLDALVKACQARLEELAPPPPPQKPQARSFCVHVGGPGAWRTKPDSLGRWEELPVPGEGEVVYIHSAVMASGLMQINRIVDDRSDAEKAENEYGATGVYIESNRHNFGGHNKLLYATNEDLEDDENNDRRQHLVASRAIDIAGGEDQLVDIDFTQRIDLIVNESISMAGTGLADWHVHGWVGAPEAIPFVGGRIGRARA